MIKNPKNKKNTNKVLPKSVYNIGNTENKVSSSLNSLDSFRDSPVPISTQIQTKKSKVNNNENKIDSNELNTKNKEHVISTDKNDNQGNN